MEFAICRHSYWFPEDDDDDYDDDADDDELLGQ